MRAVAINTEKKTVTVEGGVLWADVDTAAEKYDLACIGGTVNHTGVGGLTLGGGLGFLAGKVGLVIDNLLEAEVVLADGSIVTTSATENKDLFWAIRGAGVSFGIATKFVYQAYEQKSLVWGGTLVSPPTQLAEVVAFMNTLLEKSQGEASAIMGFGVPHTALQPCIFSAVFYNGPKEEAEKFFEPLLSLNQLANMTSMVPYSTMNSLFNDRLQAGFRRKYITKVYCLC